LVSVAILTLILIVVASMAGQTSRTWLFTTSRIEEFNAARTAFDTVSRRLSQATLNTYWDYADSTGSARTNSNSGTFVPATYARQSELRFVSGPTTGLAQNSSLAPESLPGHGVFFQAPVGYSESAASTGIQLTGLDNLLNSCGYFVQFGADTPYMPSFFATLVKPRYRFRLMEYLQPSNALTVYSWTSGNPTYTGRDWFSDAFNPPATAPVHILAENVIALIVLPKLSQQQDPTGASIAPSYTYDSANSLDTTTKNQLPPEVQLTLVALDETSAIKLAAQNGTIPPYLGLASLFQQVGDLSTSSTSAYGKDLLTLQNTLIQSRLNYRVFTTNVTIRAAKWGGH
jgi:uncharacterized protein (TIGR02599 family)